MDYEVREVLVSMKTKVTMEKEIKEEKKTAMTIYTRHTISLQDCCTYS